MTGRAWRPSLVAAALALAGQAKPAPALASLRVVEVTSALGGSEPIQPGQMLTGRGHGGSPMTFTVEELGFGVNPVAAYNRIALVRVERLPVHDSLNTVVGFRSRYRYAGAPASGGVFTFQDTSAIAPARTLTLRLQLRPL